MEPTLRCRRPARQQEYQEQSPALFKAKVSKSEEIGRVANNCLITMGLTSATGYTAGVSIPLSAAAVPLAYTGRKLAETGIGYAVYPACLESLIQSKNLKKSEINSIKFLTDLNYTCHPLRLEKSGTVYQALAVTHLETENNGKWSMHAFGNGMIYEGFVRELSERNHLRGTNSLFINGPGVSQSKGVPTRYQLGAGFEAGFQFLEKMASATHIIAEGLSLGGGMIAEGILQHNFEKGQKDGVKYLIISDRTFSRLSEIAADMTTPIVKGLFLAAGQELDCVAAARKLADYKIKQIVINHKGGGFNLSDGVITDNASLAKAVENMENKVILTSNDIAHNVDLPVSILVAREEEVGNFLT